MREGVSCYKSALKLKAAWILMLEALFDDGCAMFRWSIFMVELEGGKETRITPPGIDVFTPAASKEKDWVAVATPDQDGYRSHSS